MIRAGIVGATGYTGMELVRILRPHPRVEFGWLTSETHAGKRLCDVFPCTYSHPLISWNDACLQAVDVVFLCLPHGASMSAVQQVLEAGRRHRLERRLPLARCRHI